MGKYYQEIVYGGFRIKGDFDVVEGLSYKFEPILPFYSSDYFLHSRYYFLLYKSNLK